MAHIILKIFPESFFGSNKTLKEKMTILYGENQYLEEIHLAKKNLAIKFYVIGVIFIVLFLILTINVYLDRGEIHTIKRPDPMGGKELHTIKVEMKDEGYTYKEELKINIAERDRTEDETNQIFEAAIKKLKIEILRKNTDLLHVYTDLNLYTVDEENGVNIRWKSYNESLMSSQGQVYSKSIDKEENVTLEFELSLSDIKKTDFIDIKIVPFMQHASIDEIMNMKLSHLFMEVSEDRSNKNIKLPKTLESIDIRWYEEKGDLRGLVVIVFGIALFILLNTKYTSINNRIKRNRFEIENEYPNFIA